MLKSFSFNGKRHPQLYMLRGRTFAPGARQGMHDMTNIKNLVRGY